MEVKAINSVSYPLIVEVFDASDENIKARAGSALKDSKEYVGNKKPRQYKVYYDPKKEDYYFKIYNRKFYMNDTLRV
jgi:hypothetical protein